MYACFAYSSWYHSDWAELTCLLCDNFGSRVLAHVEHACFDVTIVVSAAHGDRK